MTGQMGKKLPASRCLRLVVVVAALAGAVSAEAFAQTRGTRPSLRILVENLASDAAACGITKESLQNEAARVLRNNGVRMAGTNERPMPLVLYLNVNVLNTRNGFCVANTRAAVKAYEPQVANSSQGFRTRDGIVEHVFCDNGVIEIWPRGNGKPSVEDAVNGCLGQIDY
jgi:hypothetical protein